MRVPNLPKKWLIHEIEYRGFKGKNDWGEDEFYEPVTIQNVRFDDSTVFSRDQTQTKILAEAVIFVDAKHSRPLPEQFTEQSKVSFRGKEYTVQKVVPCYHPTKNKIHHWELEVL